MGLIANLRTRAAEFLAPAKPNPANALVDRWMADERFRNDAANKYMGLLGQKLPNTDPILAKHGQGDLKLWASLFDDERVFTAFQQRQLGLIARDWTVDAGADDAPSKAAADHVRKQLENIRFDDVSAKMLFGRWYGYAVAEMIWAIDEDGLVAIERADVPDRAWFGFDADRELVINDALGINAVKVPERKFWVFSSGADNDFQPYGVGLAHWCYWPVYFKRGGLPKWLAFLDRFATPAVIGKVQPGMMEDDAQKAKALAALRAVYGNNQAAVPAWMEVQLLEAAGSGVEGFERLVNYCDLAITRVILGQDMTTENGSSRSQADVHLTVRDEIVAADADLLCESFNRGPAVWLTEWNFPGATPPRVYRVMDDPEDLDTLADRDTKLDALGWERTPESFESVYGDGYQKAAPKPVPPELGGQPQRSPEQGSPQFSAADLDVVDRLVADMAPDGSAAIAAMIAPLRDKLKGITDPETARLALLSFTEAAPSEAFAEVLAKAGIAARGMAEADVPAGAVK